MTGPTRSDESGKVSWVVDNACVSVCVEVIKFDIIIFIVISAEVCAVDEWKLKSRHSSFDVRFN